MGSTIQVGSSVNSVFTPSANDSSPMNLNRLQTKQCITFRRSFQHSYLTSVTSPVIWIYIHQSFFDELLHGLISLRHQVRRVVVFHYNRPYDLTLGALV